MQTVTRFAADFPHVEILIDSLTIDEILQILAARIEDERAATREREELEWAELLWDADVACDQLIVPDEIPTVRP